MRCWPKIIAVILILVTLFLIYQHFRKNRYLAPNISSGPVNTLVTIENFAGDDMCSLTPKLLDVNYDNKKGYEENPESKYYIKGSEVDANNDNKYLFVIEDSQPFHNDMSNAEDHEEIGDIRQSNHFIWVMDQARTRLLRAARKKMTEKTWIDVLLPLEDYKKIGGKRFTKNQLITAWGVSDDEFLKDQWVVLFVSDLDTAENSYFVFFKVTLSIKVPVFGDFQQLKRDAIKILGPEEKSSLFYVKVSNNYNMHGSIYFKKNILENRKKGNEDKNIYTLYGCTYIIESTESVKSTVYKINFDIKVGEINGGETNLYPTVIQVHEYHQGAGIKVNQIYEYLYVYSYLLFAYAKSYRNPSGLSSGLSSEPMKTQFVEVIKHIAVDSTLVNYFKSTGEEILGIQDLQKNRYGIYKLFARMLFNMAKCRYLGGMLDLKMDYIKNKLYVVQFNSVIRNKKNLLCSETSIPVDDTPQPTSISTDFKLPQQGESPSKSEFETIYTDKDIVEPSSDGNKQNNLLVVEDALEMSSQILVYMSKETSSLGSLDIHTGYPLSRDNPKVYYLNTFYSLPHGSGASPDKDKYGKRQDLQNFYGTKTISGINFHIQDNSRNVVGILDFKLTDYKREPSPKIKSFIKQPRRVIYTLYQEITNKFDPEKITFGRVNTQKLTVSSSECIPAQKFTYTKELIETELKSKTNEELPDKVDSVKNESLFQFFKKNMALPEGTPEENAKKFTNLNDWIHIYDLMRDEGLYDIKSQDASLELIYNSIENNDYFMDNPDRWTDKHPNLLRLAKEKIYDTKALKNYPNILTFNLLGEKAEVSSAEEETKVYLHLKFKTSIGKTKFTEDMKQGEIVDEDYNFVRLEFDTSRLGSQSPTHVEVIDNKKYDFYKLMVKPKKEVLGKNTTSQELQKYQWLRKKINNFTEFNKFILENISNEEDSRDRLRGLYEIPDMYVDDEYIKYLEESRTAIGLEDINELINIKKKIRDKNMVYNEEGKSVNLVGYPFIVFYKYIDYEGVPCEPVAKNKQKIILSNRLIPSNIVNVMAKTTRGAPFNSPKNQYPLVKQEFFSFSGNGSTIQYHEKKFGGITSIDPKKICGNKESTFMDACDKPDGKGCAATILSYTSISGVPKCEIDDESVIKKSISPVEVLVPQAVSVNACNIFLVKGNIKLYFTLGKIFGHSKKKYQLRGIYTVKNNEDKYYYVRSEKVFETDESMVVDDLGVVKDEFKFYARLKKDSYGKYYLLESYSTPGKFLTAKYHPIQHTMGGLNPIDAIPNMKFTLETEKNVYDRNHLNDEDYYAQKFNMSDALLYNTAADSVGDKLSQEIERKKRMEDSLAAQIFPELAVGDKSYKEPMTTEEEAVSLERLLDDVNSYLRKVTRINPVELPDLNLETLNEITVTMKSRIPLIKDRIQNLRYQVKFDDQNKLPSIYSKFSYPEMDSKTQEVAKSENNISANNKVMEETKKKMTLQEMGSALEAIKNFMPKSTRNPGQCKSLIESFENIYDTADMSNHLVDTYNQFVTSRVGKTENDMKNKKETLFNRLKSVGGKINSLKLDGANEQVRITQDLEKGMDVKGSVYQIRDGEQKKRMARMESKLEEIDKLRCRLGDVSTQTKVKDHPNYNSIVSREDGTLLNVYKLSECDKISEEDKKLNKNMIFVNGGCLSYDDKTGKMNVEHCMVNDKRQQFQLHKMREQNDLQAFNILNTLKPGEELENPHYIITKRKEYGVPPPSEGPAESIYSSDKCDYNYAKFNSYLSDVEENTCQKHKASNLCLDSRKGELSMRDCSHEKTQSWDYSDITGPCK